MSQPTIKEELEEEAMGEVAAMGKIAVAGKPVAKMAVNKDTTMQDVPAVVSVGKAGPSAEVVRMTLRDTME